MQPSFQEQWKKCCGTNKKTKKCVIRQALVTDFCCLWRESGGNKEGTHLSSVVGGVAVGVVMGEILKNYNCCTGKYFDRIL